MVFRFTTCQNSTVNKLFTAIPLLLLVLTTAQAQTDTLQRVSVKMLVYEDLKNEDVLKQFEQRFMQMDDLLQHTVSIAGPNLTLGDDVLAPDTQLDSLFKAKGDYETKAFKRRSGLELTGQAYGRLDNAFQVTHDEDDQYSAYVAKFQAELGWNIFNSAFFQRKSELTKIRLANELEYIKQSREKNKAIYEAAGNLLTMEYNYYIAIVLYHELQNIDILNQSYQYMLEQDRISNDKLLETINDKMELEYTLAQTYDLKDIANEPLYALTPTVISIDTVRFYEEIERYNPDLRASYVEEQLLNTERKLTNYGQTMRLTPFLRGSTYIRKLDAPSYNIDLGVRFTFPLYSEAGAKRRAIDTEKQIVVEGRQSLSEDMKSYCRIRFDRVDRLNRAIRTEAYHIAQLGKYVEMRRNAYLKQPKGYNYIIRLEEYNQYLKSMERMYKLMLNRCLALLDIQKTTSYNNLQALIIETPVK